MAVTRTSSDVSTRFSALAPGIEAAPRLVADDEPTPAEDGYLHCGTHGAGHFVKMVHNAIEYGLMAAYAEGFNLLEHPPDYQFDLPEIAGLWRRGSVIGSWLLDLLLVPWRKTLRCPLSKVASATRARGVGPCRPP